MKERNINVWLPLALPLLGTWPGLQPRHVLWLEIDHVTLLVRKPRAQSTETHQPGPCNVFIILLSVFFISDWFFFVFHLHFYVSYLFVEYSISLYTLPLNSLSILITNVLNSKSSRLLVFILLITFLEFCSLLAFFFIDVGKFWVFHNYV